MSLLPARMQFADPMPALGKKVTPPAKPTMLTREQEFERFDHGSPPEPKTTLVPGAAWVGVDLASGEDEMVLAPFKLWELKHAPFHAAEIEKERLRKIRWLVGQPPPLMKGETAMQHYELSMMTNGERRFQHEYEESWGASQHIAEIRREQAEMAHSAKVQLEAAMLSAVPPIMVRHEDYLRGKRKAAWAEHVGRHSK